MQVYCPAFHTKGDIFFCMEADTEAVSKMLYTSSLYG